MNTKYLKKTILSAFVTFTFFISFSQSNYSTDTLTYKDKGSYPNGTGTYIVSGATWMVTNLYVTRFLNGEHIQICYDKYDWERVSGRRTPAMYFFDKNHPSLGAYYNYYALTDPRGIIPNGYRLPTKKNWEDLGSFIQKSKDNKDTTNLNLFLGGFYGYIGDDGEINQRGKYNYWWSSNHTSNHVYVFGSGINELKNLTTPMLQNSPGLPKSYGLSIKCIKDLPVSLVKTYVSANGEDSLTAEFDRNGHAQGKGVFANKDYVYKGSFNDTKFDGEGIQTYRNGEKVIGTWNNGSKNGVFTKVSLSGVTKKSYWNNNVEITTNEEPLGQTIMNMSEANRQLYLIDNGKYLAKFKSCKLEGGSMVLHI